MLAWAVRGGRERLLGGLRAPDEVRAATSEYQAEVDKIAPFIAECRILQYSSRAGENVLALFGGSGSTLIAGEPTGRNAYLMELDRPDCDVIVQRWENLTGKKVERQSSRIGYLVRGA